MQPTPASRAGHPSHRSPLCAELEIPSPVLFSHAREASADSPPPAVHRWSAEAEWRVPSPVPWPVRGCSSVRRRGSARWPVPLPYKYSPPWLPCVWLAGSCACPADRLRETRTLWPHRPDGESSRPSRPECHLPAARHDSAASCAGSGSWFCRMSPAHPLARSSLHPRLGPGRSVAQPCPVGAVPHGYVRRRPSSRPHRYPLDLSPARRCFPSASQGHDMWAAHSSSLLSSIKCHMLSFPSVSCNALLKSSASMNGCSARSLDQISMVLSMPMKRTSLSMPAIFR